MTSSFSADSGPRWYCLKARPRFERLTAQALRAEGDIGVFCPLVRFQRARGNGKAWVLEAMFPGYLFAQFDYLARHRLIRATRGVSTVVSFGDRPTVVPDEIVAELRLHVADEETVVIRQGLSVGEEVSIVEGPFKGLRALVTKVLPSRERVGILLELLGTEREVEIACDAVLPDVEHPLIRRD